MNAYVRFPTRAMGLNTALVNTYARLPVLCSTVVKLIYMFANTVCACCHLFYVSTCEYVT